MTEKKLYFSQAPLFLILITLLVPSTALSSGVDIEIEQEQETILAEIKFDHEILEKHKLKAGLEPEVFVEKLKEAFDEKTRAEIKIKRDKAIKEMNISLDTIIFLTQLNPGLIYNYTEREFNDWIVTALHTESQKNNFKGALTPGNINSNNLNANSSVDSGNIGRPGQQQSQALARQYFRPRLLVGGSVFLATLFFILKR